MSALFLDQLINFFNGSIVHFTSFEAFKSIYEDKAIKPNIDAKYSSPFGRYKPYFASKGCVSFFDFRELEKSTGNVASCNPISILNQTGRLVALELSKTKYSSLISWEDCKIHGLNGCNIVPNLEVGFRGDVSLGDISKLCVITKPKVYSAPLQIKILS